MNKKILTVLVLSGIFFCGAVFGAFVGVRFTRGLVQKKAVEQQIAAPQWQSLSDQLNLNEEQRAQVRLIMKRYAQDQQAVRKELQGIAERMDEGIKVELSDEQRTKYIELRSKQREADKNWQRAMKELRNKRGDAPPPSGGAVGAPQAPSAGENPPAKP